MACGYWDTVNVSYFIILYVCNVTKNTAGSRIKQSLASWQVYENLACLNPFSFICDDQTCTHLSFNSCKPQL